MYRLKSSDIEGFKKFIKTKGKKILLYHQDSDGITSAALLLKYFPEMERLVREGPRIEVDFVQHIIAKNPALIIFIDLPVDQEWSALQLLENGLPKAKVIIIDHHIPEKNLNSEKILHINPQLEQDTYVSTSYLIYNILEELKKKPENDVWIACIGAIGDYAFDESGDLFEKCRKIFPGLISGLPMRSELAKGAELLASAMTAKSLKGADRALEILLKSENFYEFARSTELQEWDEQVKREIARILNDFDRKKEVVGDVILYEINSEMSITSVIASVLTQRYADSIIVIRKQSQKGWKISIRAQSGKINVGDTIKKCVHKLGSGGGHKKAGGAVISDWDTFKKRFVDEVRKARSG